MTPAAAPFWTVLGSLWPLYVAIIAILWFTGALGGLAGVVAAGASAVMNFGVNFLARTIALGVALALVLIAIMVFNSLGMPSIGGFFPSSATTAPSAPAAPAPPPAP